MSGQVSSEVYHLVNPFSKLYVTFILQWIAFIFGRDEEEDQQMFGMQERQLLLSSLLKKPVHNAIRHFSCLPIFSARQAIHMKCQALFSLKKKKKKEFENVICNNFE